VGGRLGEIGAAPAERGLLAESVAHFLDLFADLLPLLLLGANQLLQIGLFLPQRLVLALDLDLLEPAQIAQAHVEDGVGLELGELERLDQDGLRLVLAADDLDDPIEVEIGDEEATQYFEPVLDRRKPVTRAAQQDIAPMVEPFAQHLGKIHHLGNLAAREHVHVERDAALKLGQLEQRFHQQPGVDHARARLDHDTDILGRLVAEIGDEGQLLGVEQFRHLLD